MRKISSTVLTFAVCVAAGLPAAVPAQALSNSPVTPADTRQYAVKIDSGFGACTGALIDRQWVATTASCFSEDPAQFAGIQAGVPSRASKVQFGANTANRDKPGTAITRIEPVANAGGRDFALVKLANPINDVTPVKMSTSAPSTGESLEFTGYGRTADEWVPEKAHTGTFSVTASDATSINLSGSSAGAALCAGDSGAPGIRTTANGPELVAVNSRSWQNGCLYVQTQNTGAVATRLDDLAGWIHSVVTGGRTIPGIGNGTVVEIRSGAQQVNCLAFQDNIAQAQPCATTQSKKWELTQTAANTFTLRNAVSQQCLVGSTEPQRAQLIRQGSCDASNPFASWEFIPGTDGTTILKNVGNQAFTAFKTANNGANVFHAAPRYGVGTEWSLAAVGTFQAQSPSGPAAAPPAPSALPAAPTAGPSGLDISDWQIGTDWAAQAANGLKFAYIKATEGNRFTNALLGEQYAGTGAAGIAHGSYHVARPDLSSGKEQANYFVSNGGGWNPNGTALPPVLDLETNPNDPANACYGLSVADMSTWITDFSNMMVLRAGRLPAISTSTEWWNKCTGSNQSFSANPLYFTARGSTAGTLPAGWTRYTAWQYSGSATNADPIGSGYRSVFNGTPAELASLASTKGPVPNLPAPSFVDVATNNVYYKEITWLASVGISTGWPDGTFRPLDSVNRDAMAAFMYRLAGKPAFTPPATSPFVDVATNNMYYKEITWLASAGISTGWSDGTFRPLDSVNRDAMAAFMYRLAGKPAFTPPATSPFPDVATNNVYYKEITWLAAAKVSSGWSDGTFRPLDTVKRDAMAAFMYRLNASMNNK